MLPDADWDQVGQLCPKNAMTNAHAFWRCAERAGILRLFRAGASALGMANVRSASLEHTTGSSRPWHRNLGPIFVKRRRARKAGHRSRAGESPKRDPHSPWLADRARFSWRGSLLPILGGSPDRRTTPHRRRVAQHTLLPAPHDLPAPTARGRTLCTAGRAQ